MRLLPGWPADPLDRRIPGSQDCELRAFLDGPSALAAAESEPPDLIRLDISMAIELRDGLTQMIAHEMRSPFGSIAIALAQD